MKNCCLERIQFVRHRVGETRRHYVNEQDVKVVLERLPEELWTRLRKVHFKDDSRGARVLGYTTRRGRREISLCALPQRVSLRGIRAAGGPEQFGALVGGQWPVRSVRRYLLYNTLLHEIGHFQIIHPKASNPRRKFAGETKAQEFADHWRAKLWAESFDHPDPVHNSPGEAELKALHEGWGEANTAYKKGLQLSRNAQHHYDWLNLSEENERALREYMRAISLYPDHALALEAAGKMIYHQFGEMSPQESLLTAAVFLRRATAIDSELPDAWLFLAMTLARLGEREQSQQAFKKAIGLCGCKGFAATVYADHLCRWKQVEKAEILLKSILKNQPMFPMPYQVYADLLLSRSVDTDDDESSVSDVQEAITLLQKAIEIRPDFSTAHRSLALLYSLLEGYDDDALQHARKCVEIDPEDTVATELITELEG